MLKVKLCFSIPSGASAYSNANFGSSSGPYHLDDVYCRGSETSLFSCNLYAGIGVHNCRPGNEAGVKCVGKIMLEFIRPTYNYSVFCGSSIKIQ